MMRELLKVAAVLTAVLCLGCAQQSRPSADSAPRLLVPIQTPVAPPTVVFSDIYSNQFKTASQTQQDMNFCVQNAYDDPVQSADPRDAVNEAYMLCMLHHGHRVQLRNGAVVTPEQYRIVPPFYEAGNMPAAPRTQQRPPTPELARSVAQPLPQQPPQTVPPPARRASEPGQPSSDSPTTARQPPSVNAFDVLPIVARFKRVANHYALQLLLAAHPTARFDGQACATRPADGFTLAIAVDCRTGWRDRAGVPKLLVVTYRLTISKSGVDALAVETSDVSAYRGANVAKTVAIKLFSDRYAKDSLVGRTALGLLDSQVTIQVAIGELLRAVVNTTDPM